MGLQGGKKRGKKDDIQPTTPPNSEEICGKCEKPKWEWEGFCNCGRPSPYRETAGDEMIAYFKRCQQEIFVDISYYKASDKQIELMAEQGHDVWPVILGSMKSTNHKLIKDIFPTFQRFASNYEYQTLDKDGKPMKDKDGQDIKKVGVHIDTLHEWKDKHKEFSEAYRICKDIQEAILVENGLQGSYNATLVQFLLKNNHGYRDKQEIEQTTRHELTEEQKKEILERLHLNEQDE